MNFYSNLIYLSIYKLFNIFYRNIGYYYNNYVKIHYIRYNKGLQLENKENNASSIISRSIKNYNSSKKELAAKNIQRIFRGHLDRKEIVKRKIAAKMIKDWYEKIKAKNNLEITNNDNKNYKFLSFFNK